MLLFEQKYKVTRQDRNKKNNHSSLFVLFTGYSGAGKSALANGIEQKLHALKINTYILDGDNVRRKINKDLGFSQTDRSENIRRISEVSSLFMDAGTVVLAAFIAPLKEDRALMKQIVGQNNYIEIFVNTSLKTCKKRDPKNLYKLAETGKIKNMTGVDAIYEMPINPTFKINEEMPYEESIEKISNYILDCIQLPSFG